MKEKTWLIQRGFGSDDYSVFTGTNLELELQSLHANFSATEFQVWELDLSTKQKYVIKTTLNKLEG